MYLTEIWGVDLCGSSDIVPIE